MHTEYEEVRQRLIEEKKKTEIKPGIGLLPTGHLYYWPQFPNLKKMGMDMYQKLIKMLKKYADLVVPELVDTAEKAEKAGRLYETGDIDMLLIFPLGYTTSMMIVPAVYELDVPIRILNAHEDRSYDYAAADTTIYLHHEGSPASRNIQGPW